MSKLLRKICPARSSAARHRRAGQPSEHGLLPWFLANSATICGDRSPARPAGSFNSRLDRVARIDTIIFTMIRRSAKPDPKLRALQESGTANPHAYAVQDPAFVDSDFFDSHDLIQVRYEMLRRVRT